MVAFYGEDRKPIDTMNRLAFRSEPAALANTGSLTPPFEPMGFMVTTKFTDGTLDSVVLLNDELIEALKGLDIIEIDYFTVKRIG